MHWWTFLGYFMEMSQSLFSWIHLSYCISGCAKRSGSSASQSLFSWIHLSYKSANISSSIDFKSCLNPYFPGFIFLILYIDPRLDAVSMESQSLFSWIHLSYTMRMASLKTILFWVSILIFLDSSFLYEENKLWFGEYDWCLNPYFPGFIFLIYLAGMAMMVVYAAVSILIFLDSSFLYP